MANDACTRLTPGTNAQALQPLVAKAGLFARAACNQHQVYLALLHPCGSCRHYLSPSADGQRASRMCVCVGCSPVCAWAVPLPVGAVASRLQPHIQRLTHQEHLICASCSSKTRRRRHRRRRRSSVSAPLDITYSGALRKPLNSRVRAQAAHRFAIHKQWGLRFNGLQTRGDWIRRSSTEPCP
jgi:hypothetical protein